MHIMSEVQSYNVITDQDPDILNHGSVSHIRKYFLNLEKKEDSTVLLYPKKKESKYSVNSASFVVKLILLIIFLFIVFDYAK